MSGNPTASDSANNCRISILIASIGRPALLRTLESVDAVEVPEGHDVEVIIVDDSPDLRVKPLLEGRDWRLPLRVVELGSRNVSHARNALLDAATGEWGLFVDDDEYVDTEWVAGHLRAAAAFDADAVFGPVWFVYPETTPQWFKDANFLWEDMGWSDNGKAVSTGATGNTLIRMSTVRRMGLRFDPAFGRIGGGDTDFFNRMTAAGGRLVLTDWARAWQEIPETRATPAYVLERAERTGANFAKRALAGATARRRLGFAANAALKFVVAGVATMVALPFGPTVRYRFQAMAWSNIGKLRTVVGAAELDGWASEV